MSTRTKTSLGTVLLALLLAGIAGAYLMKSPKGGDDPKDDEDYRAIFIMADWQPTPHLPEGVRVEITINEKPVMDKRHERSAFLAEIDGKVGDGVVVKITATSRESVLACLLGSIKSDGSRVVIDEQPPTRVAKGQWIICQGVME